MNLSSFVTTVIRNGNRNVLRQLQNINIKNSWSD